MTTQTISKRRISGAMKRKDQPEWTDSGPISPLRSLIYVNSVLSSLQCASGVPDCRVNKNPWNARAEDAGVWRFQAKAEYTPVKAVPV